MLKKSIKYTDFDGNEQVDTFYFNLSKSELTKTELRHATLQGEKVSGGFRDQLLAIMNAGRGQEIIDTFEDILRMSYGVRSEDGKRFIKNDENFQEFQQTAAYDVFFMELVTDADAAAKFINEIVPADISEGISTMDQSDVPEAFRIKQPTATPEPEKSATDAFGQVEASTTSVPETQPQLTEEEIAEIMRKRNAQ